jgi:hypothetical protein
MATATTYSPSTVTYAHREDLSDVITNISPTDTVFMSNIGKTKINAKYHEWLTDELTTAANCAVTEGNDAVTSDIIVQARLGNYTQIAAKWFAISDTLETVDKAGRKSDIAYQTTLYLKMLARDMEFGLINNRTKTNTYDHPRQAMGLRGWLTTHDYLFTTGSASTTLEEGDFNAVIEHIWADGGNPSMVMVPSGLKRNISKFNGNGKITTNMNADDKRIILAVDYYESDFGILKVYANRFIDSDAQQKTPSGKGALTGYYSCYILEKEKFQLGVLQPLKTEKLARTGLATKIQMSTEYTLISRQEKASGRIQRCAPA